MTSARLRIAACVAAAVLSLGGCGSGDGDRGPPEPVAVFPVAPVVRSLATRGLAFHGVRRSADGGAGTIDLAYRPVDADTFTRDHTITLPTGTFSGTMRFDYRDEPGGGLAYTGFATSDPMVPSTGFAPATSLPFTAPPNAPPAALSNAFTVTGGGVATSYFWTLTRIDDRSADLCFSLSTFSGGLLVVTEDCFLVDGEGTILRTRVRTRTSVRTAASESVYE